MDSLEAPSSAEANSYRTESPLRCLHPYYTRKLLADVLGEVEIRPPCEAPPGVEAVRRKTEGSSFLFVLNHSEEEAAVELGLERPGTDLLTGEKRGERLVLEPLGVAIVEEDG